MKVISSIFLMICISFFACSKSQPATGINNTDTSLFAKGADVSWITEMENAGYKFNNNNGIPEDCMQLLKEKGINSIRLRAWVNPVNGWCNTNDVVQKA